MVAIVTGSGLGLFNSSLSVLGEQGRVGDASLGQGNENFYVNASSGNLSVRNRDEFIASQGLDTSLIRTYNSQGLLDDDNGDNWRFNIAYLKELSSAANSAGSSITRIGGDGSETLYSYDVAKGLYTSTDGSGAHDTLSYNASTDSWRWTDGSTRVEEIYNLNAATSTYQLSIRQDQDANQTVYSYNAAGLITQINDASANQTLLINYDTTVTNRVASLTTQTLDENNVPVSITATRYAYDTQGRLSTLTIDLTPNDLSDSRNYVTTYTYYDGLGNNRLINTISQSDGTSVSFAYEAIANSSDYRIKTVTDGNNVVTNYVYDTLNNETRVTNSALNTTIVYRYDSESKLIEIQAPDLADGSQIRTQFEYDIEDNVSAVVDGRGNRVEYEYDDNGNRILERDALGNTVSRIYSINNLLLTETTYLTPDPDGAGVQNASDPQSTRYVYDGEAHLRFVVSDSGRVTEYRYNAQGQRSSEISYLQNTYDTSTLTDTSVLTRVQLLTWVSGQGDLTQTQRIDSAYDAFRGQLETITRYEQIDATGAGVLSGASTTRYVYDQHGQLLQRIDPRGEATLGDATDYLTSFVYDGMGRLINTTDARGISTKIGFNDGGNSWDTTYSNGLRVQNYYDANGRNGAQINWNGGQLLDVVVNSFDSLGRLRVVQDEKGGVSQILYDAANRPVMRISAEGSVSETGYDAAGNVVFQVTYGLALDDVTRLTLTGDLDLQSNSVASIRDLVKNDLINSDDRYQWNVYNAANQLIYQLSGISKLGSFTNYSVTQFAYDGAGQLTDEVRYRAAVTDINMGIPQIADRSSWISEADVLSVIVSNAAFDRQTRYFYNAEGQRIATLDGEGYLVEFSYNNAGQLIRSVASINQLSIGGLPVNSLDSTQQAQLTALHSQGDLSAIKAEIASGSANDRVSLSYYNAQGQRTAQINIDGYLTEYSYDPAGNLEDENTYNTVIQNHYQLTGNESQSALNSLRPAPDNSLDRRIVSQYDDLNQLVRVTRYDGNETLGIATDYVYDDQGNLISSSRGLNTSDVRTTLSKFDLFGRVIAQLDGIGSEKIAQLSPSLSASDRRIAEDAIWAQHQIQFTYDKAGNRTSNTDQNGNIKYYYYDDANRLRYTLTVTSSNVLGALSGELSEIIYNSFGEVADTVRYQQRLNVSSITGSLLSGQDTTITNVISLAMQSDVQNSQTQTRYNLQGAIKSVLDAEGNSTTFETNSFGEVLRRYSPTAADTSRTTFSAYDRRGLLVVKMDAFTLRSISFRDAFGRLTQTIDANGNAVNYGYEQDSSGRQVEVVTDGVGERRISYDAFNRVLTQIDGVGRQSTYSYFNVEGEGEGVLVNTQGRLSIQQTNAFGDVTRDIDPKFKAVTNSYDKNGNLTQSVDREGNITQFLYDDANRLIRELDPKGIYTDYTYDSANRLTQTIVDAATGGLNLTTRYQYDGKGQRFQVIAPNNVITETEYDRNGQVTAVVVDKGGLELRTEYSYAAEGSVLTVTEGAGTAQARVTAYQYDQFNRRISETLDPAGEQLTTRYYYDGNGNVTAKITGDGTAEASTTRYVYDERDRQIWQVDAEGSVVKTDYDAENRVIRTTQYSDAIDLSGVSINAPLTEAVILAALDPSGTRDSSADRIQRVIYNLQGEATYSIDAEGAVTRFVRDSNGNAVATIQYATALTNTELSALDISGDQSQTIVGLLDSTSAQNRYTYAVYDNNNRITHRVDERQYVTEFIYDARGQVVQSIEHARAIVTNLKVTVNTPSLTESYILGQTLADNADRVTLNVYDGAGRQTFGIDALGYVTENRYDANGQVIETLRYANAINVQENVGINNFAISYDSASNLIVNGAVGSGTSLVLDAGAYDESTPTQTNVLVRSPLSGQYNAFGSYQGLSSATGDGAFAFDGDAWVRASVSATNWQGQVNIQDGIFTQGTYQIRVLIEDKDYANSVAVAADGAIFQQVDGDGRWSRTTNLQLEVDAAGNISRAIHIPDAAEIRELLSVNSAEDQRTKTVYDNAGRIRHSIDASGYVTSTLYDARSNITRVKRHSDALTNSNGYSVLNLANPTVADVGRELIGHTNADKDQVTQYIYDNADRVKYVVDALGYVSESVYDAQGNVTQSTRYNDVIGTALNVRASVSDIQVALSARTTVDATKNQTSQFIYDGVNRLAYSVDGLGYVSETLYDALGNITQTSRYNDALSSALSINASISDVQSALTARTAVDATKDQITQFIYDEAGRVTTQTYAVNSAEQYSESLAYDAWGNVLRRTDGNGNKAYFAYDNAGQLTRSIDQAGFVVDNAYSAFGEVASEIIWMNAITQTAALGDDRWAEKNNATLGLVANSDLNSGDRIIAYSYDRRGQLVNQTQGSTTEYTQSLVIDSIGLPEVVSDGTFLDVSISDNGNGVAVWKVPNNDGTRNYTIYSAQYDSDKGWLAAERISPEIAYATGSSEGSPSVVVNDNGNAFAIWGQRTRDRGGMYLWGNKFIPSKGGWQTPFQIENGSGLVRSKSMAIDGQGNVMITWNQLASDARVTVYAVYYDELTDTLGPVEEVDVIALDVSIPGQMVFDNNGDVIAVWEQKDANGINMLWTRKYIPNNGWQPVEFLDPESSPNLKRYNNFQLNRDANGNITAIWVNSTSSEIRTSQYVNGAWQPAEVIGSFTSGAVVSSKIDVSKNGDKFAVWTVNDADVYKMYTNYFESGTSWAGVTELSLPSSGIIVDLKLTPDSKGNAVLVWTQREFNPYKIGSYSSVFVKEEGWQTPIEYTGKAGSFTDVSVDGADNFTSSWYEGSQLATQKFTLETPQLLVKQFQYDAFGNVVSTTDAAGLAEATTTQQVFDNRNQLVSQTLAYGLAEQSTTEYQYDGYGNQTTVIDPRGVELATSNSAWAVAERARINAAENKTYNSDFSLLSTTEQDELKARYILSQNYDSLNRKTITTDAIGGVTSVVYDSFNNVVKSIDPNSGAGYFYYDSLNRETLQIDPEGYVTQLVVDARNNILQTIKYATAISASTFYDENNRPQTIVTDAQKDQRTYAQYDVLNRTTQITDAEGFIESFSYDAVGNVVQNIDKNNNLFVYTYDTVGNRTEEYLPVFVSTTNQVINRFEYDSQGNQTKKIEAYGLLEQRSTEYVYDTNNQIIETIEPDVLVAEKGNVISRNSLQTVTNSGINIDFNYDSSTGNSQIAITLDQAIAGLGDGNLKIEYKAWDILGARIGSVAPVTTGSVEYVSATTSMGINLLGREISNTKITPVEYEINIYKDINGKWVPIKTIATQFVWDDTNTVWTAINRDIVRGVIQLPPSMLNATSAQVRYWDNTPSSNRVSSYEMEELTVKILSPGLLILPEKAAYWVTATDIELFDDNGESLGRIETETGQQVLSNRTIDTVTTEVIYDTPTLEKPRIFNEYDARGNLIRTTDANGNSVRHYYDGKNRRIATIDAERYYTAFVYDAAGNIITEKIYATALPLTQAGVPLDLDVIVPPSPIVSAINDREKYYRYDAQNRLVETLTQSVLTYIDETSGFGRNKQLSTRLAYDTNGNVVQETDANGNSKFNFYNDIGLLIVKVDELNYVTVWDYDANGNAVKQTQFANALSLPFDQNTDPQNLIDAANLQKSADDRVVVSQYDRMNQQVSESLLNVNRSQVNYTNGVLSTTNAVAATTTYSYDGNGNIISTVKPEGGREDYSYDALDRRISEQGVAFTGYDNLTKRTTVNYIYDAFGNVISRVNKGQTPAEDQIEKIQYDSSGNVTEELDALGAYTRYYYDLNGNVVSQRKLKTDADGAKSVVETGYEYDKLNQQTTTIYERPYGNHTGLSTGLKEQVTYNAYGEVISKGLASVNATSTFGYGGNDVYFKYDKLGRVIETNKDDGVVRLYKYDANGNVTWSSQGYRAEPGTVYTYDAKNQLDETYRLQFNPSLIDRRLETTTDPLEGGVIEFSPASANIDLTFTAFIGGIVLQVDSIPLNFPSYGDGVVKLVWTDINTTNGTQTEYESIFLDGTSSVSVGTSGFNPVISDSYTVSLYKQVNGRDILVTSKSGAYAFDSVTNISTDSMFKSKELVFKGLGDKAAFMDLTLHPSLLTPHPTQPTVVNLEPVIDRNGNRINGWFSFKGDTLYTTKETGVDYTTKDINQTELEKMQATIRYQSSGKLLWQGKYFAAGSEVEPQGVTSQTYNAFGEVATQTDALANTISYFYNTQGKLAQRVDPLTTIFGSDGFLRMSPVTKFYYDLEGRQVGIQDANDIQRIEDNPALAPRINTSYYDQAGLLLKEFNAMGDQRQYGYDVFGNKRTQTIGNSMLSNFVYDAKNQLTQFTQVDIDQYVSSPQVTETYEYDEWGRRISHTNGRGFKESTYFDNQNRIIKEVSYGGLITNYDYDYDVTKSELTVSQGKKYDLENYFGRVTSRRDYGGRVYSYTYDLQGQLTQQYYSRSEFVDGVTTVYVQDINYKYNQDGTIKNIIDKTLNSYTEYEYDLNGNRIYESYAQDTGNGLVYYQQSSAVYDELNRITSISDPDYSINYRYDANGNRVRITTRYLNSTDASLYQSYDYEYDGVNRMVVAKKGGGQNGSPLAYNQNGQRIQDGNENYIYDSYGRIYEIYITDEATGTKYLGVRRQYDQAGNVISNTEFDQAGTATQTTKTYTKDNRVSTRTEGGNTTYNRYRSLGDLFYVWTPGQGANTTTIYNASLWDAPKTSEIKISGVITDYNPQLPWKPGVSKFNYNENGQLTQVEDVVGKRLINYTVDQEGRILGRREVDSSGTKTVSRAQRFYYFNGNGVGDAGDWGIEQRDYGQILAARNDKPAKEIKPVTSANFDYGYSPLNDNNPGFSNGSYTVQAGDTLERIALSLWGDSSLWYFIADANGIDNTQLTAGLSLIIPAVNTNIQNNSTTFKPYSEGELLGNHAPTLPDAPPPPPPPKKSCGIKQIIVVVVAVVAAAYLGPLAANLLAAAATSIGAAVGLGAASLGMTILAGAGAAIGYAAGAALGNFASQLVAKGLGVIDEIDRGSIRDSFKVTGITTAIIGVPTSGLSFTSAAGRAIVNEGVSTAVIDDYEFNWNNVAVAAISSPVNKYINNKVKGALSGTAFDSATTIGNQNVGIGVLSGVATNTFSSFATYQINGRKKAFRPDVNSILGNAFGGQISAFIPTPKFSSNGIYGAFSGENVDDTLNRFEGAVVDGVGSAIDWVGEAVGGLFGGDQVPLPQSPRPAPEPRLAADNRLRRREPFGLFSDRDPLLLASNTLGDSGRSSFDEDGLYDPDATDDVPLSRPIDGKIDAFTGSLIDLDDVENLSMNEVNSLIGKLTTSGEEITGVSSDSLSGQVELILQESNEIELNKLRRIEDRLLEKSSEALSGIGEEVALPREAEDLFQVIGEFGVSLKALFAKAKFDTESGSLKFEGGVRIGVTEWTLDTELNFKSKIKINDYNEISVRERVAGDGKFQKIYIGPIIADSNGKIGIGVPLLRWAEVLSEKLLPKGEGFKFKAEILFNTKEAVLRLPNVEPVRMTLENLDNTINQYNIYQDATRKLSNVRDQISQLNNQNLSNTSRLYEFTINDFQ